MARKRIFILGAGLAGLSAARYLQKNGRECVVFEKEPEIGGLCRSKEINGFSFDLAGHLLHFRRRQVKELIKKLLREGLYEHKRSAWVYAYGRHIRYPFQANFQRLPPRIAKECLQGFICASRKAVSLNPNFLHWINSMFGKGIAKHFMIPYNKKFWMIPLQNLTCDWLNGFIPLPSLSQIIQAESHGQSNEFGYNSRFWYPKNGGIKQLPLSLAKHVKRIYVDCPIEKIDLQKKEIKISGRQKEKFDCLISTLPLPEMANIVRGVPQEIRSLFKKLKWNSIFNLNLGVERKERTERHWIYFPQKSVSFFRVGFFHGFSPCLAPFGKTSLYAEVAYSQKRSINKSKIVGEIKKGLREMGILDVNDNICAQDINDIKYAYPIYDKNYQDVRKGILDFLKKKQVFSCGRYGAWQYMSMEDAIFSGIEAAEGLI